MNITINDVDPATVSAIFSAAAVTSTSREAASPVGLCDDDEFGPIPPRRRRAGTQGPKSTLSTVGRPPIAIDLEALSKAAETGCTQGAAARLIGVDLSTLKRHLADDPAAAAIWLLRAPRPKKFRRPEAIQADRVWKLAAAGLQKVEAAAALRLTAHQFSHLSRTNRAIARAWALGHAEALVAKYS